MTVNWARLAEELGSLVPDGELGGDQFARLALGELLGEAELRRAVNYYVQHRPGSELVRSVLRLLRPRAAAEECYRLFRESSNLDERQSAVELLRGVADNRALVWLEEFLEDPDTSIQNWGAGLLDQLVFCELIDAEAAEPWILKTEQHPNEEVRRQARWIRVFLRDRQVSQAASWNGIRHT